MIRKQQRYRVIRQQFGTFVVSRAYTHIILLIYVTE